MEWSYLSTILLAIVVFNLIIGPVVIVRWLLNRTKTTYIPFSVPLAERQKPPRVFPAPGECFVADYAGREKFRARLQVEKGQIRSLRVVTLNMEFGMQLDRVIAQLDALQPDIVLLQEVDICSYRTGNVNTAAEVARALRMNLFFTCEVTLPEPKKLKSEGRARHAHPGVEGNAVLSRFEFLSTRAVPLKCQRLPGRLQHSSYLTHCEAAAVIDTPLGPIEAYSLHLDPHETGVRGRIAQYSELMSDVCRLPRPPSSPCIDEPARKRQPEATNSDAKSSSDSANARANVGRKFPLQILAGDLNTVCHGVARFNKAIASDFHSMFRTIGYSEAEWFQKHAVEACNKKFDRKFHDPFDKRSQSHITFSGMSGIYTGKLDWILLSEGLKAVRAEVGHLPSQKCSDHYWLCVDVVRDDS